MCWLVLRGLLITTIFHTFMYGLLHIQKQIAVFSETKLHIVLHSTSCIFCTCATFESFLFVRNRILVVSIHPNGQKSEMLCAEKKVFPVSWDGANGWYDRSTCPGSFFNEACFYQARERRRTSFAAAIELDFCSARRRDAGGDLTIVYLEKKQSPIEGEERFPLYSNLYARANSSCMTVHCDKVASWRRFVDGEHNKIFSVVHGLRSLFFLRFLSPLAGVRVICVFVDLRSGSMTCLSLDRSFRPGFAR